MANPLELFKSSEAFIAYNTKWPLADKERVQKAVASQDLKSHIWVASSGTENARPNFIKLVALTKNAFLIAAESVCQTLDIQSQDVYLNTLPLFHVGGISTMARAHTSGCVHIQSEAKWEARSFVKLLSEKNATLTSIVPTQVYDIVTQKLSAPSSLRFAFVGGGALSLELVLQARSLGWSLVSTYGMTETAAMMAFKKETCDTYTLFPHIESIRATSDLRLQIKSQALLSGYLFVGETIEFQDPKVEGWFTSGDKVRVDGKTLELLGRESELVKIKGETVSLLELNQHFESFCLKNKITGKTVVLANPHMRDGFELIAVSEQKIDQVVLSQFNQSQIPFCRIARSIKIDKMPTTPLGKMDIAALRTML